MYFPGWQSYVDNVIVPTRPDKDGIVTFSLAKGLHYIEVRYDDLATYAALKTVSLSAFLGISLTASLLLLRKLMARFG